MQKAVFLDRDGTLNYDSIHVFRVEDLVILPGVAEWLHLLKQAWFLLILVTNQSGIGRGYFTYDQFKSFTDELAKRVNISFDAIYFCPHLPDENCLCRKPKTQHLLDAKEKFSIDMHLSFFVGDKETDVCCGNQGWCTSILLGSEPTSTAHYQASSFLDAVHYMLWLSPTSKN